MQPIFDSHLDLSFNALSYDRDQTWTVEQLRAREVNMPEWDRGTPVLSLPELREARVGLCLATLLARARPLDVPTESPNRVTINYGTQSIAYGVARGQLGYYELLEQQGHIRLVRTASEMRDAWDARQRDPDHVPLGIVLSMEGADPIPTPEHAREWFDRGLRTMSLAHYGPSAYAYGTGGDGPLTDAGRAMLPILDEVGMILDVTHTAHTSFYQAFDLFGGRVFASHNNCRELVAGDRQFSDEQIRMIAERDGVIGAVLDSWMLVNDYKRDRDKPSPATLHDVANHIAHVCDVTGTAKHAAIGTDLDGGFDGKQAPGDLNTYRDLHALEGILSDKGISDTDIALIMHGNWLRFFSEALPQTD